MRAVRLDRYGDYSELKLVTVPTPGPTDDELLIQVRVAAVNPIDSTIRLGLFSGAKQAPLVPGQEASGVVIANATNDYPVGTRVLVRGGYGIVRDGTWQEFVTALPNQILRAPRGLDDATVAATGSGYLAAALALDRAGFAAGKSVLALGVGGAVGNAAYQLARARGASVVIGTAGSTAKAELARSLGFDSIIDLSTESLEEASTKLTNGRGVDIVVDSLGGPITSHALKTLANDGTLIALGYVAGASTEINLQDMVRRRAAILAVGLARMPPDSVHTLYESMRQEFETHALRPRVARSFPLEEAAEAQRFLDQDRPFGKVVLQVSSDSGD
jgi:NADPH:quinone reductase